MEPLSLSVFAQDGLPKNEREYKCLGKHSHIFLCCEKWYAELIERKIIYLRAFKKREGKKWGGNNAWNGFHFSNYRVWKGGERKSERERETERCWKWAFVRLNTHTREYRQTRTVKIYGDLLFAYFCDLWRRKRKRIFPLFIHLCLDQYPSDFFARCSGSLLLSVGCHL